MLHLWSDPSLKFISNFYPHAIEIKEQSWPTAEHFYQAHKSLDPNVQDFIKNLSSPGKAKREGQKIQLSPDWSHRKFMVMMEALVAKFKAPTLQSQLLSLKGIIVEDNKDLIWGSGVKGNLGPGSNMLGKLLMLTRDFYAGSLHSPLKNLILPETGSAGDFSTERKFDVHTGIDLYCPEHSEVYSLSKGRVINIVPFTGALAESPWWEDTEAVLVEHDFGVVLYGEVSSNVQIGQEVSSGSLLGRVKRVLKKDKGLPQSMLHLEYYNITNTNGVWWNKNQDIPPGLLNPRLLFPQHLRNENV